MNCEDLNEALVDLVDGRLDGAAQRTVERHLEGCQNCRALLEDLRSIRAAAFMLDRREPKAETWSKVRAAIASEPVPRGRLIEMGMGRRHSGGGLRQRSSGAGRGGCGVLGGHRAALRAAEPQHPRDHQRHTQRDAGSGQGQLAALPPRRVGSACVEHLARGFLDDRLVDALAPACVGAQ